MPRARIELVATVAANGATVTPSAATELPLGMDIAGVQCVWDVPAGYGGGNVDCFLEGSNDDLAPANWTPIALVTANRNADGVAMLEQSPARQVVALGHFKWVRLNVTINAGPLGGAGTFTASAVSPGSAGY